MSDLDGYNKPLQENFLPSMKVAIAGATGVLGRSLIPRLLQQGHTVLALARSVDKARALFGDEIEASDCDLLAPDAAERLSSLLPGCQAAAHLATAIPSNPAAPGAWDDTARLRTIGTRVLLQSCLEAGVERYVQQSIIMAYPDQGDEWIIESTPLDHSAGRATVCGPVMEMEAQLRRIPTGRIRWSILRGGNFVGPGTAQERVIENLRAGKERVLCDGSNYLSLIHVDDMARAVLLALEQAPGGTILNIVADPLRQGEYLDRLAEKIGAPRPQRNSSAACPPSWRCSRQAAKLILGWEPVESIL